MVRSLTIVFVALLFAFSLNAQSLRPSNELAAIHSVQTVILPIKDNKTLLAEELKERRKGRPNTFAVAEIRDIKTNTHGTWESTKSGFDVWRLVVHSKGAKSINLGFDQFKLPKSAQLYLYDIDKNMVLLPFTAKDNDDHMQLWTPVIEGDKLVLELHIDPNELEDLQLHLKYINHDFVGITQASVSGSCNVDVICGAADGFPEVDQYRDIIQAGASYSINGIQACPGSLINNAKNDCKPYFLTADHCGISINNSPSVVVYWNYFNSYCRIPDSPESGQNGDGVRTEFNSGATFRAAYEPSDFLLIEMDDPLEADHNLFMSGWNREPDDFSGGIAIHHPGVEEKRIAFEDDPLVYMHPDLPNINETDTTMIIVDDWDLGTTEGGSSGSPLYNKEKQLVGQLYGGFAACGNDRYDRYGWIGHSWEGGGTPATQLKVWLDPDNSGLTQMPGLNCAVTLVSDNSSFEMCNLNDDDATVNYTPNGFSNDIALTVQDKPADVVVNFSSNPLPFDQDLEISISNLSALASGNYEIKILADDMTSQSELLVNFTIYDGISPAPLLTYPSDGQEDLSASIEFTWRDENAITYDFEISDTQDFSNVLLTQNGLEENLLNIDFLDEDKTYFWRVRNTNLCGTSDWSDVFTFSVGIQRCFTHKLIENLPIEIDGGNPNEVNLPFDLNYKCNISDVNVLKFRGEHSFVGDLVVSLTHGSDVVTLMNSICDSENDFDLGFDDIGAAQIPCPPIDGNIYQPSESLRVFNNGDLEGNWNFIVQDTEFFDGGEVQEVVMEYCYTSTSGSTIIPSDNYFSVCSNESVEIPFSYFDVDISQIAANINVPVFISADTNDPTLGYLLINDLTQLDEGLNTIQFGATGIFVTTIYIDITPSAETTLIFPQANSIVPASTVTEFIWEAIPGINNYFFELSDDENFSNILFSENTNDNRIDLVFALTPELQYYVRVSASNDCGDAMPEFTFTTDSSTSTEDTQQAFMVYPNPADNQINITTNKIIESLKIYNTNGSLVVQTTPFSESCQLEINNLENGLYIVKIKSGNNTQTKKIVIQHGK